MNDQRTIAFITPEEAKLQYTTVSEADQLDVCQKLVGGYIDALVCHGPSAFIVYVNEEGHDHNLAPNKAGTKLLRALNFWKHVPGACLGTIVLIPCKNGDEVEMSESHRLVLETTFAMCAQNSVHLELE